MITDESDAIQCILPIYTPNMKTIMTNLSYDFFIFVNWVFSFIIMNFIYINLIDKSKI